MQEESSEFWEVILSVILRKKFHINMCLILNGYRDRVVSIYKYKGTGKDKKEREITYS
jgi:hypothetical protein